MFRIVLLLLFKCGVCVHSLELSQPVAVVVRTTEPLVLTCKVTGYSVSSGNAEYATGWIRHPKGKPLEWISHIWDDGDIFKNNALSNKFTISRDSTSNSVSLRGQNLQESDTAVYYCARVSPWNADYFDYWGKGTVVTVSDSAVQAPTVFPLVQCGSGTGEVTIGCMATGFTPASLTFKWEFGGSELADAVQYPTAKKDNQYTGVSQIRVRRQDWDTRKPFTCSAVHAGGTAKAEVFKQVERVISPNITLYPVWTGQSWASELSLVCTLSGFYPDKVSVEWLLDGRVPETSPVQNKLQSVAEVGKTFTLNSKIQLKIEEWKKGPNVQCKSKYGHGKEATRNISICAIYSYPPSVHLTTPSFKTVIEAGSDVTAACVVHTAFDVNVTWHLDGKALTTPNHVTEVKEGALTRSNLTVSSSQWKKLNFITCRAEHCFTTVEKNTSVAGSLSHSQPSALLLQGPNELVCLAYGFSPASINITWLLDGTTQLRSYNTSEPHRGPKGKFSIQSRLPLSPHEWLPGQMYTCRVNHCNGNIALNMSKPEILEESVLFDENKQVFVQDMGEDNWMMTITFLLLFFVSLFYGILVTVIKTK